jgi:hypothetical protein
MSSSSTTAGISPFGKVGGVIAGLALALISFCASYARAQPTPDAVKPNPTAVAATPVESCRVRLRRADPAFAEQLLGLIRDLGACSNAIDIYVVAVNGGYYVLARDSSGKIQDRTVPDLVTASALIASWSETVIDASPKRASSEFDPENPDPAQSEIAAQQRLASANRNKVLTLTALAGNNGESLSARSVEMSLDLTTIGDAVVLASIGYQRDTRLGTVRSSDDNVNGFLTGQLGPWFGASVRQPVLTVVNFSVMAGLDGGVIRRRRIFASEVPGIPISSAETTNFLVRLRIGLEAGWSLDRHVAFLGTGALTLGTGAESSAAFGYLFGAGLRYTP